MSYDGDEESAITEIQSEGILGLNHDGHAEGDHVDVYLFVPDCVHLQEIVRFCLSELAFVDMVQFL